MFDRKPHQPSWYTRFTGKCTIIINIEKLHGVVCTFGKGQKLSTIQYWKYKEETIQNLSNFFKTSQEKCKFL